MIGGTGHHVTVDDDAASNEREINSVAHFILWISMK